MSVGMYLASHPEKLFLFFRVSLFVSRLNKIFAPNPLKILTTTDFPVQNPPVIPITIIFYLKNINYIFTDERR